MSPQRSSFVDSLEFPTVGLRMGSGRWRGCVRGRHGQFARRLAQDRYRSRLGWVGSWCFAPPVLRVDTAQHARETGPRILLGETNSVGYRFTTTEARKIDRTLAKAENSLTKPGNRTTGGSAALLTGGASGLVGDCPQCP